MIPSRPCCDINDHRESDDNAEPIDANDPIESIERNDPAEPTERTDPTEPIDRTDPTEPIDRIESSDHNDQRDRGLVISHHRRTRSASTARTDPGQVQGHRWVGREHENYID